MHTKTNVSVTFEEILKAKDVLENVAIKTKLYECPNLSKLTGNNVFLKTENLQKTGAFKIRGAFNKIANLTDDERKCGVIASSAGNHDSNACHCPFGKGQGYKGRWSRGCASRRCLRRCIP